MNMTVGDDDDADEEQNLLPRLMVSGLICTNNAIVDGHGGKVTV